MLYGVSAKLKLFALDAANGKELWVFDPVAEAMTSGDSSAYFSLTPVAVLHIIQMAKMISVYSILRGKTFLYKCGERQTHRFICKQWQT